MLLKSFSILFFQKDDPYGKAILNGNPEKATPKVKNFFKKSKWIKNSFFFHFFIKETKEFFTYVKDFGSDEDAAEFAKYYCENDDVYAFSRWKVAHYAAAFQLFVNQVDLKKKNSLLRKTLDSMAAIYYDQVKRFLI